MALPIVMLSRGVSTVWSEAWLKLRRAEGLNADQDACLLRSYDDGSGWLRRRAAVREVTQWVRAFLEAPDLETRSFKPTVLSWAAKHENP
jgi:hypothetical protein